jgi:polysaccharide export outer membrane protein
MRQGLWILSIAAVVASLSLAGPVQAQQGDRVSGVDRGPRTLSPGDMLRISVWPNDDLSGEFVVEETGYAYLPMLGRVQVEGVPIDELRSELRAGYAEAVKNPVVTITPVFNIGVLGEVRSPGVYTATPSTTVLDVVGQAGGFTNRADQEQLRLVREGQAIQYNAERALEQGLDVSALRLRSGDRVVVPVRSQGITFGSVMTFIQTGATIAFLIDRATD